MIKIRLNGEIQEFPASSTLVDLVATLGRDPRGVAIERNGEIVPKSQHDDVQLQDGDALEVVQFVGGG